MISYQVVISCLGFEPTDESYHIISLIQTIHFSFACFELIVSLFFVFFFNIRFCHFLF